MVKTREYQALLDACSQTGCLLCNLTQESVHHYLDTWKYELFTDMELRQELRQTQGFCHTHTWQLVRMGAILPIAQAYRDILSDTITQLQQASNAATPATGGLLSRIFDSKQPPSTKTDCPACQQRIKAEERYIHTLRLALLDDEFLTRFSAATGLCLDHFRLTNALKTSHVSGDWSQRLRQAQLSCLTRLEAQLSELIRKHDYHFKDEARGSEMHSWIRAAGLVASEDA
jgi:hypothetical protein